MPSYEITLACRSYDRTEPIIAGQTRAAGIDLKVVEMDDVPRMLAGMARGEYDVSEFSLAELVYAVSRGKRDFVGIPVFPFRMFRHGYLFCHAASRISGPKDLEGKKIAFPRLAQTACIWIRGTLLDDYALSPTKMSWYAASLHNWDEGPEKDEVRIRDGSVFRWLEKRGRNADQSVDLALGDGSVDVLGTAIYPSCFTRADGTVKRLFENYREVEKDYYKRTGIFPIMHLLAARRSVTDRHPDLPQRLFELFSRAKQSAKERMRTKPYSSLVWKDHYVAEEEETFQGDPWVYGLKKNIGALEKFLSYSYDVGVSERKLSPEELFIPSTWDLTE